MASLARLGIRCNFFGQKIFAWYFIKIERYVIKCSYINAMSMSWPAAAYMRGDACMHHLTGSSVVASTSDDSLSLGHLGTSFSEIQIKYECFFQLNKSVVSKIMMTSSNGNIFVLLTGLPVTSHHKGRWRGALMFSLVCTWINGCVNIREAGD